jgi:RNA polymerase sigma factor (sigma-70 family)
VSAAGPRIHLACKKSHRARHLDSDGGDAPGRSRGRACRRAPGDRGHRPPRRAHHSTGVLGDRDLAGDVAQDVAVDALRGLAGLRELERFDAWVRRIAVRHTLRAANARRRRWHAEVPLAALANEALAPEAPEPTEVLILRDALQRALPMLSPRQRLALALRYVHGLSDAEIAAALGCRPGTAASLCRAPARRYSSTAPSPM